MNTLSRREFLRSFFSKETSRFFDEQPGDGDPGITEWREWLKDSLSRFPNYGYGSDDDWLGQALAAVDLSSFKFGRYTLRNLLEHVAQRRYEGCAQGKKESGGGLRDGRGETCRGVKLLLI